MLRTFLPLALGLCLSAVALAQARAPIPSVVLDHMNDLDQRCVAAGGRRRLSPGHASMHDWWLFRFYDERFDGNTAPGGIRLPSDGW